LTTTWAKRSGPAFVLKRRQGCNLYPERGILRIDILGTLIADDVEFRRFDAKDLGDLNIHLYMTFAVCVRYIEVDDFAAYVGR